MRTSKRDNVCIVLVLALLSLPIFFSNSNSPVDNQDSIVIVSDDTGMGSGVAVGDGTFILTNAHVAGETTNCFDITNSAGQKGRACTLWISRPGHDLALLKLEHGRVKPVTIRKEPVRTGEKIAAWGHPLGMVYSMTTGTVSAPVRYLQDGLYGPFFQMDLVVAPGNSGGGIFDEDGRMVGITSRGLAPFGIPIGINYAVPNTVICQYIHCE